MIPDIKDLFNQFLQVHHLKNSPKKWLVAVSGGMDSVVLCHLCMQFKIPFAMAHCNFKLRGAESDSDQAFVTALAQQLDTELFVKQFDTLQYMADTGSSVQVAARELRYAWFNDILLHAANTASTTVQPYLPLQLLATAHHANDNVETVLMNLFRGTGIKGIRGILPMHNHIIRPLLQVSRAAIVDYAESNGLTWVEDSSNSSDKYRRNFIRNNVVPMLEKTMPDAVPGFISSLAMITEAEQLYNEAIDLHKKKLIQKVGNEMHVPVLKLAASKPLKTIAFEIIKEFGFTTSQTDEVLLLLDSESGRYVASPTHRIIRNRDWLIIAPQKTDAAGFILIEKADANVLYKEGHIEIEHATVNGSFSIPQSLDEALLNAAEITFPLILRPWKQGDYFYPLGMMKKKKLARFFIDQKLSTTDKEKIWVIESNKKILWVVGHRIDERFKVTAATKQVLRLQVRCK